MPRISHYLLEPDGERISVYLEDDGVFATKETPIHRWTSSQHQVKHSFRQTPKTTRAAALGDVVESLMAHIATVANDSIYPRTSMMKSTMDLGKNLPGLYCQRPLSPSLARRDPIANWREIRKLAC